MDRYKIERALGIIEGISWGITESTIAGSLTAAVEMIENALQEPCCGEVEK